MDPTKGQHQSAKRTDPARIELIQVHKVDGPHQGSTIVHKVNGPTQGQTYTSPQSGQTPPRVNTNPQSGRTNQGQTYTSPQNGRAQQRPWAFRNPQRGRTRPRLKTTIHTMDGPKQSQKYKSTKWTAINRHDHIPRNERTQPGSQTLLKSTT